MPSLSAPIPLLAPPAWRQWLRRRQPLPAAYDLHADGVAWPSRRDVSDGPSESLALGPGGVRAVSLRARQFLRVTCTAGTAWLTCERDARDHVLEAGAEHLAGPGDALVLLGMPSATVVITAC
jgi:hypothetical protein